ncbi:RNA-binding protein YhbY [compost metagenome]
MSILTNNTDDKHEVAEELARGTGAELVQLIGKTVILYKESTDNKRIVLPR